MRLRRQLAILVAATFLAAPPAGAQFAVFDAPNYVQNTLTAVRMLQELNNQVVQLQNEAKMLINQALNLASLPMDIVWQLRSTLAQTTQLIQQAQGVAWQLQQARAQYQRFYPGSYSPGTPGFMMANDALVRWANSWQALETTIGMQAQAAQNLASDEAALAQLVQWSQGALGILQASQATNQLLALHARQMIQGQQLRLTQDRSAALEQARSVVAEARAREVRRHFQGTGTRYTPRPIQLYGF